MQLQVTLSVGGVHLALVPFCTFVMYVDCSEHPKASRTQLQKPEMHSIERNRMKLPVKR